MSEKACFLGLANCKPVVDGTRDMLSLLDLMGEADVFGESWFLR